MKPKQKKDFFSLLCILCPGAAEMYMGLMRQGLSLLLVFAAPLVLSAMGVMMGAFLILSLVIWVFGFFHGLNLRSAEPEDFARLADRWIWEEFFPVQGETPPEKRNSKIPAWTLLLLGCGLLWGYVRRILWQLDLLPIYEQMLNLPQLGIALALLLLGFRMLRRKKQEAVQALPAAQLPADEEKKD